MLDVGCGTGGSAFYMAREFGVSVTAMDLSSHMIDIANKRLKETNKDLQEKVGAIGSSW